MSIPRRATPVKGAKIPSSWSERFQALKTVPPLLRMVYKAHPGLTLATILSRLVRPLSPIALLWIGKLII